MKFSITLAVSIALLSHQTVQFGRWSNFYGPPQQQSPPPQQQSPPPQQQSPPPQQQSPPPQQQPSPPPQQQSPPPKQQKQCSWYERNNNGKCQCSDMECALNDQWCSALYAQGAVCAACRENDNCPNDHQGCYNNDCVCLDSLCKQDNEDKPFCKRQYSKTSDCVECRQDKHCPALQKCRDDGVCICDNKKCPQPKVCMDDGTCGCQDDACPANLICDQEGADGACIVAVQCKQNSDCGRGRSCSNNLCTCTATSCNILDTTAFNFECRNGRYCSAPCTNANNFLTGCPANYFCLDQNGATAGGTFCYANNLVCRAGQFLIEDACPPTTNCLLESEIAQVQTSPFCAPTCLAANNFCEGLDCPLAYQDAILGAQFPACLTVTVGTVDTHVCACLNTL